MELEPVSVALKFGFLAVLYLFLLWVARSALKDLRRGTEVAYTRSERGRRGRDRHAFGLVRAGPEPRPTEAAREHRRRSGVRLCL